MQQDTFKYRGRIPVRSDGKARREAILEATLALIISEGIRGVRHRAVAEKANVPLAATTYYFNDIFDLIHDAFIFYSEKAMADIQEFEAEAFGMLEQLDNKPLSQQELVDAITDYTMNYIVQQAGKLDFRVLEHTFRTQALRDERVAEMVKVIEKQQIETIIAFLSQLGIQQGESRARLIFNIIVRLEYELTLHMITPDLAEKIVRETLALVFSPEK